MVILIIDKTQNYSKVTKLLVKPLIFNLLNHIYFLCVFDFFLFIVTIHTIISLRKKIMIPESISSGILNPNSIIEIEITDKQIIGVLPNKTIIKDLSEFTNYMIVKDGVFLMINRKRKKIYTIYTFKKTRINSFI